jgi:hypothetical protein
MPAANFPALAIITDRTASGERPHVAQSKYSWLIPSQARESQVTKKSPMNTVKVNDVCFGVSFEGSYFEGADVMNIVQAETISRATDELL